MGKLMNALIVVGLVAIPVTSYVNHHSREVDRAVNSAVQSVGEHVFGVIPEQPPTHQMTESEVNGVRAYAADQAKQDIVRSCFNHRHDLGECFASDLDYRIDMKTITDYSTSDAAQFYGSYRSSFGLAHVATIDPTSVKRLRNWRSLVESFADSSKYIRAKSIFDKRCIVRKVYAQAFRNLLPATADAWGSLYPDHISPPQMWGDNCDPYVRDILRGRTTYIMPISIGN